MIHKKTFLLLVCTKVFSLIAISQEPNFILILSDDQGWTGTSVKMDPLNPESGSDYIETPNLERLAESGMRFSRAYSAASMCSPSRVSIQYGMSTSRLWKDDNYERHEESKTRIMAATSIPQMLKSLNPDYVTAHLGKWHQWPDPGAVGYDIHDGSTDNPEGNVLKRGNPQKGIEAVPLPQDDPKRIFSLTKKAIDFMTEQAEAGNPFFLQISHYAVHERHMALETTIEKYKNKPRGKWHHREMFAACAEDLDTGVGMLIDKVKELGLDDNTYIIYTSDNGAKAISPDELEVNKPLRRGKFIAMEGGIRVPFIIAGPDVPANSHSATPIWGCDIWATIHDLVNPKKSIPENLDGGSLYPLFAKKGQGDVTRKGIPEGLVFHCTNGTEWSGTRRQSAIIDGDYKLIINHFNRGETLLFNVVNDPYEWNNLAEKMYEKRKELEGNLKLYHKRVDALPATMSEEQLKDMADPIQAILEKRKGWTRSRIEKPTEYPVNSFSEREGETLR